MLETEMRVFPFRYKEIWFGDRLYDPGGCDSVFFRSCKEKLSGNGFRCYREFTTQVIDLGQSLEAIWKNMSKSNCRKPIERAIRDGVTIRRDDRHLEFYDLYRGFARRKGFDGSCRGVEYMKQYGVLFTIDYEGELLGGMFYLKDNDNIIEQITASRRLDSQKADRSFIGNANKLLIWEAIKYARDQGITEYDQGGIYLGKKPDPQLEKINLYKRSFGGKPAIRYYYRKDYSGLASFLKTYVLKD